MKTIIETVAASGRFTTVLAALSFAVVLSGTASAQSTGSWKLNLAKSTYLQGQAPKGTTLVYEPAGAGVKVTVDTVPATGAPIHYTYTANYDGQDVPVVGNPNADMAARTRVNATTTKLVNKKGGKVVSEMTFTESADGKMLTITAKGVNADGQTADSTAVYDKQ